LDVVRDVLADAASKRLGTPVMVTKYLVGAEVVDCDGGKSTHVFVDPETTYVDDLGLARVMEIHCEEQVRDRMP
jgi:hypothetical protein